MEQQEKEEDLDYIVEEEEEESESMGQRSKVDRKLKAKKLCFCRLSTWKSQTRTLFFISKYARFYSQNCFQDVGAFITPCCYGV